jgi:2-dehydro-3-deoxygalactonokinase
MALGGGSTACSGMEAEVSGTFVAIDWGSSALRAYCCAADGRILAAIRNNGGILNRAEPFEVRLAGVLAALQAEPAAAVLMAGMIGSRQGWIEAPYVETPCGVARLAEQLTPVQNALKRKVWIVPGLCDPSGPAPDVMRGEETQLLGLFASGRAAATVCLPGTHCKWVDVADGTIRHFKTYMTGEVFQLLSDHSILGRLMPPGLAADADDWDAFDRALDHAARGGGLLSDIFAVRTLGLFDQVPASGLKSYLSGLLIGHEIAAATATGQGEPVTIVGESRLAQRYARALARRGHRVDLAGEDVVVDGLRFLAGAAGLV